MRFAAMFWTTLRPTEIRCSGRVNNFVAACREFFRLPRWAWSGLAAAWLVIVGAEHRRERNARQHNRHHQSSRNVPLTRCRRFANKNNSSPNWWGCARKPVMPKCRALSRVPGASARKPRPALEYECLKPRPLRHDFRILRRCVFALIALVTLVVLFYAEEKFRGKRAWNRYRKSAEARGVQFDFAALIPPPIPDEQNGAITPLIQSWFLKPQYGDTNRWPNFSAKRTAGFGSPRASKPITRTIGA